jgi:TonB family protein
MSRARTSRLTTITSEPELTWMIAISAILHIAAGLVVVSLPRGFLLRTPAPVVAYTVKIVDPSALGGRLTKGELHPETPPSAVTSPAVKEEQKAPAPPPPPPEPKVEEKQAKVEPEKPAEKVVKIPDVPKKPEKKAEEKKPPATPKPSKEEQARASRDRDIQEAIKHLGEKGKGKQASGLGGTEDGKGAALGVGGDGGGGGVLTGLDFIIYKNQVEGIIKKNWTWVGANPNLTIRIGFSIANDGQITDVHVVERSGDSSFDDSVMSAIRISTPLPAPPEKYRQTFANYVLDFVSGDLAAGG